MYGFIESCKAKGQYLKKQISNINLGRLFVRTTKSGATLKLQYPADLRGLLTFLEQAILRQYLEENHISMGVIKNVG